MNGCFYVCIYVCMYVYMYLRMYVYYTIVVVPEISVENLIIFMYVY
jgi:hypothetical protein